LQREGSKAEVEMLGWKLNCAGGLEEGGGESWSVSRKKLSGSKSNGIFSQVLLLK
jgi:hypothetical protein